MEFYKNWLRENNVKFTEEKFGLTFNYQGGHFVIQNNGDDLLYLSIVMPGIFTFEDEPEVPREKVLEALNEINREFKVVKAVCDDEDCWLATEMLLDTNPDVDDFMERLFDIMHQSRLKFFHILKYS